MQKLAPTASEERSFVPIFVPAGKIYSGTLCSLQDASLRSVNLPEAGAPIAPPFFRFWQAVWMWLLLLEAKAM